MENAGTDVTLFTSLINEILADLGPWAPQKIRYCFTLDNLNVHHHAQLINAIIPAPVDVPQWFNASKTIVQLVRHTLNGAQLVQHLMFKLQILPLTKSSSLALLETFGHILWEEIVPGILNTCCFASFISSSFYLLRRREA